jgi:single-strand DNA-binding protein
MYNDINKVVFSGNVGRDIEVAVTKNGFPIGKFSMAVTRSYKKAGASEYEKETTWLNVSVLGKYANALEGKIKKGTYVVVEGRLEIREYEKDGEKKFFTGVICDNLRIVGNSSGGGKAASGNGPIQSEFDNAGSDNGDSVDADIPF